MVRGQNGLNILVPMEGLEPPHSSEYQILSLARLPIPPHRPPTCVNAGPLSYTIDRRCRKHPIQMLADAGSCSRAASAAIARFTPPWCGLMLGQNVNAL